VWHAGAPGGGDGDRQAPDSDAQDDGRGGGYQLGGDRDDRRRVRDAPPRQVSPHVRRDRDEPQQRQPAAVGEQFHGRTKGDWNHRTTRPISFTTILRPVIQESLHSPAPRLKTGGFISVMKVVCISRGPVKQLPKARHLSELNPASR